MEFVRLYFMIGISEMTSIDDLFTDDEKPVGMWEPASFLRIV